MANGSLSANVDAILSSGKDFENYADMYNTLMDKLKDDAMTLKNSWKSEASDAFQRTLDEHQEVLDQMEIAFSEFSTLLENAGKGLKDAEQKIMEI